MAKKVTKKPTASRRNTASAKAAPKRKSRASATTAKPARAKGSTGRKPESSTSAADALVGLLESPLVADILAAGAAAALASFTQHSLSRRSEGGSAKALKNAAKAAGTAMATRISTEFEGILESAKANASKK